MAHLNLQNVTIENEVVVVQDKSSFNAIGSDVVLRNCELQIAVPSRALSIAGTIIGGTVIAKRELQGFDWLDARLDGVTFQGRFKNNRFGNFPPMFRNGTLAKCDFTDAKLRDALFLNTPCNGVTFPSWPFFTITNTPEFHQNVGTADAAEISDYLNSLSEYIYEYNDDSVTLNFMTVDALELCKRQKFDLDSLENQFDAVGGIIK